MRSHLSTRLIAASGLALALLASRRAAADEVPPFSEPERPKPPPVVKPAAPPAVAAAAAPDEVPPPTRSIEVSFSFPAHGTVAIPTRDTLGQDVIFDATVRWGLGGGLDVGGTLDYVPWRNYQTAYVGEINHALRALASARYTYGDALLRPYARVGVGAGVSVMAPDFTIYDLPGHGGVHGTTTVDARTAPAYVYEVACGFRRVLEGRIEVVGELALRGAEMRHHLTFTDDTGATSETQGVGVRELDARVGVAYAF